MCESINVFLQKRGYMNLCLSGVRIIRNSKVIFSLTRYLTTSLSNVPWFNYLLVCI